MHKTKTQTEDMTDTKVALLAFSTQNMSTFTHNISSTKYLNEIYNATLLNVAFSRPVVCLLEQGQKRFPILGKLPWKRGHKQDC